MESKEVKLVFDWLDNPTPTKRSKVTDRMNFLSPADFRESRAKEIVARVCDANGKGFWNEDELR